MRSIGAVAASLLFLLLAIGVAACGDQRPGVSAPEQRSEEPRDVHIHGLGVAPRDGTLYVATHGGLFSAADGQRRLRRVGDSQQDLMGFSMVRDNLFVASGHPPPGDSAGPPNVGLIESRDAGVTWDDVSLRGEADFHVLRAAGSRVYGFDGAQARLLVSGDGGRRWAERRAPGTMLDLAIAPRASDEVVTSTDRGLFASRDAGMTWRRLRRDIGLLAWPADDRLYLVNAAGQVERSRDGGRRWRAAGSIEAAPVAFTGRGSELYVALVDATVKRSDDGGKSWTARAAP